MNNKMRFKTGKVKMIQCFKNQPCKSFSFPHINALYYFFNKQWIHPHCILKTYPRLQITSLSIFMSMGDKTKEPHIRGSMGQNFISQAPSKWRKALQTVHPIWILCLEYHVQWYKKLPRDQGQHNPTMPLQTSVIIHGNQSGITCQYWVWPLTEMDLDN